jgi:hypothetical protein
MWISTDLTTVLNVSVYTLGCWMWILTDEITVVDVCSSTQAPDMDFYRLNYRAGHLFIDLGARCRFLQTQRPYWTSLYRHGRHIWLSIESTTMVVISLSTRTIRVVDMNGIYTTEHIQLRFGLSPYYPNSTSALFRGGGDVCRY